MHGVHNVLYVPVQSEYMRGPKFEILLELLANEKDLTLECRVWIVPVRVETSVEVYDCWNPSK